ncbi:alanine racemase [Alteribacillus persepolensis]|uniref:Alanine racemase n=1 Tax=Alteribacillus persepolensis TaxID=568899 RepID=A0A1G8FGM8_9BACI|nr:alanine racemase [Alteribacillus persepolensis]SDH81159.1 alanine racemase [Alteribacillus persepolensis]
MAFKQSSYRDTWVEVDVENIKENVSNAAAQFKQTMHIMAVVKADGYGHGAVPTAKAALEAGASFLGVALLEEALELREAGIEAPILVLGRTRPQDAELAAKYRIRLTAFQKEWIQQAEECLSSGNVLDIHLKVDTGMGRIGMTNTMQLSDFLETLKEYRGIRVEGLFTHFATADEKNHTYFLKQYQRFLEMVQTVEEQHGAPRYIHCGNSAAGLRFPDKCFNMFRFGIAMYGLTPSADISDQLPFPLKEAFSLHSRIIQIKKLPPGESISYGATYTTTEEEWIGTVPIGYADGWYRYHASKGGEVLVNGQRVPIVGRVCMDQMMIKLPGYTPVDTKVTLIGSQGDCAITVLEAAERLETITYEIPCMISNRVPRVYV